MMVTSPLQEFGLFIVIFFPVAALASVVLRLYSRSQTRLLGTDDVCVVIAMVMSIGETYSTWMYMKTNFVGIHAKDIPEHDIVPGLKYNYAVQVLYNPILAIIKASVLLFLLRLTGQKKSIKYSIWALFVLNFALMIAIFVLVIFQCTPIAYNWDFSIEGGHCVQQGAFYVSTAAITIFTDILVLIIPFWIVMGLKMARKTKIAVISVFFLGFLVTVVGIVRLVVITKAFFGAPGPDPTYSISFTTSAIETNLAIITANAPALKPFVKKHFPKLFSSYSQGDPYSGPYAGGSSYAIRKSIRTNGGPGGLRSGHGGFALKDMKGRSEIRSTNHGGSEEEIMTFNGIIKTTDVSVKYMDGTSQNSGKDDLGMRTSVDSTV